MVSELTFSTNIKLIGSFCIIIAAFSTDIKLPWVFIPQLPLPTISSKSAFRFETRTCSKLKQSWLCLLKISETKKASFTLKSGVLIHRCLQWRLWFKPLLKIHQWQLKNSQNFYLWVSHILFLWNLITTIFASGNNKWSLQSKVTDYKDLSSLSLQFLHVFYWKKMHKPEMWTKPLLSGNNKTNYFFHGSSRWSLRKFFRG